MGILENYVNNSCDKRLPGAFSFSVRKAFSKLDELIEREPILKIKASRNAYGHLRNAFVQILLETEIERQNIDAQVSWKEVSNNGYRYPVIESKGILVTEHKIRTPKSVPEKSWYKDNRSFLNKEISLFDDEINEEYGRDKTPYVMLTYGGKNYNLDFIQLALPDYGVTKWVDTYDITNAFSMVKPYTTNQEKEIDLTFTKKVAEYIEERNNERNIQS
ncbi:hypothetical protein [Secundilactobacillus kimchicus]|uniref:hypothetical protein n=1 Tax=Secundilactobacillus kimchicus TaxID=528209 RepID=UPI0024A9657A|nr:hypothetical protein [Secundilactobacillus kimchicus]